MRMVEITQKGSVTAFPFCSLQMLGKIPRKHPIGVFIQDGELKMNQVR